MSSSDRASSAQQLTPKQIAARQKEVYTLASSSIKSYVDLLTGSTWKGAYEDSLYNTPDGPKDYGIPADTISFNFARRGKLDSTFTADRIIKYNGKDYPESFIGSVAPNGRVVMNSLTDTDILIGRINAKSGTMSLLFFDDGAATSSLGSQTAVGTYVFINTSNAFSGLPSW